jgi:hypothetical protein
LGALKRKQMSQHINVKIYVTRQDAVDPYSEV